MRQGESREMSTFTTCFFNLSLGIKFKLRSLPCPSLPLVAIWVSSSVFTAFHFSPSGVLQFDCNMNGVDYFY